MAKITANGIQIEYDTFQQRQPLGAAPARYNAKIQFGQADHGLGRIYHYSELTAPEP